jgi:glycosyltransferase involved in cell wall biosynthesis
MLYAYTLFFVFFWGLLNKRNKPVVICDILNYSISWAALLACKLNKTRTTAIVTDLPGVLLNTNENRTKGTRLFSFFVKKSIHGFDSFILFTEQMNAVLNPKNRPYIIMEGLVDKNMALATNLLKNKPVEQIIHYAGGLYEMYGIKELIEGFMMLNSPQARLHLFGHGDMTAQIAAYCKKDSRITYFGVLPNEQVIADQINATLLVNPRRSNLELAKFSFPSKNMEYMASGTPLLTTALPGMPVEYQEHVYIIQNENPFGIYQSLKQLLSLSKEELHAKGTRAKEFVLDKKCNTVQAGRVINLVSGFYNNNQR